MRLLHTLRHTPWLVRVALLWYALTVGVSAAAPMVHPLQEILICTSTGMVSLFVDADGTPSTVPSSRLHCAQCVPVALPVVVQLSLRHIPPHDDPPQPLALIVPVPAPRAAPPPCRAPPARA